MTYMDWCMRLRPLEMVIYWSFDHCWSGAPRVCCIIGADIRIEFDEMFSPRLLCSADIFQLHLILFGILSACGKQKINFPQRDNRWLHVIISAQFVSFWECGKLFSRNDSRKISTETVQRTIDLKEFFFNANACYVPSLNEPTAHERERFYCDVLLFSCS